MTTLFWALLALSSPDFQPIQTEIYRPLDPTFLALAKNRIYILDQESGEVQIYDGKGQAVARFGRKGQGPDEFALANGIWADDKNCYIFDLLPNKLKVFDAEGRYVRDMDLPQSNQNFFLVANGWLLGSWGFQTAPEDGARLFKLDKAFANKSLLFDLTPGKPVTPLQQNFRFDFNKGMPTNPAIEKRLVAVSPDGTKVFVRQVSHDVKISILDVAQAEKTGEIALDVTPIPFNTEWGQEQIDAQNEGTEAPSGGFRLKAIPDFPEYFPSVRDMRAMSNGRLYVRFWSPQPDRGGEIKAFTFDGREVPCDLPEPAFDLAMDINGSEALVLYFDKKEEETRMTKVPLSELASFARANPKPKKDSNIIVRLGH